MNKIAKIIAKDTGLLLMLLGVLVIIVQIFLGAIIIPQYPHWYDPAAIEAEKQLVISAAAGGVVTIAGTALREVSKA